MASKPTQITHVSALVVTIVRAQDLWGDQTTATDGYVKVFDKHNIQIGRTDTIMNNNSPYWERTFDLGDVVVAENDKIKLEVWDEDSKWDDDLLGTCEVAIKAGQNYNFCTLNHGLLLFMLTLAIFLKHIIYIVTTVLCSFILHIVLLKIIFVYCK
uniref:C2 domain-containing protein n=1 Tax=Sinocyclocheilus grahami TaxID=75366 RepID=A0A672JYN2_SINGR